MTPFQRGCVRSPVYPGTNSDASGAPPVLASDPSFFDRNPNGAFRVRSVYFLVIAKVFQARACAAAPDAAVSPAAGTKHVNC